MDENTLLVAPQPSNPAPAMPKPITDLSPRVVELARKIDRLPPGSYEIEIIKGEVRAQDWKVEIVRTEKIETFTASKYHPE